MKIQRIPYRSDRVLDTFVENTLSETTRSRYESLWERFTVTHPDIPREPVVVARYLAGIACTCSASTLAQHASALAWGYRRDGHESPTHHQVVLDLLRGHRRTVGTAQHQADPLDQEAWNAIRLTDTGVRDLALIGLMRDAALRRSEASDLVWADLTFKRDGSGLVEVRKQKNDQESKGAVRWVSKDVTGLLREWKQIEKRSPNSPIFGLCGRQISRRIAAAAKRAGLDGDYSGHSPRIGIIQDLARAGMSTPAIAAVTGHQSHDQVLAYTRGITASTSAVAQYYERKSNVA